VRPVQVAVDWLCRCALAVPYLWWWAARGWRRPDSTDSTSVFPCCLLNPPIPEKKAAAGWLRGKTQEEPAFFLPLAGCVRWVFRRKGHSTTRTAVQRSQRTTSVTHEQ
jgi:hypothetical protein